MIATLVHRGPDAEGVWSDVTGRCVLGHRRLSIIDTSEAGRQPMVSGNGRWVITFNGEIYNFQELRLALAAEGIAVRGRTDTEVLIESISLWGIEALCKLDGMFAFGAFNIESGELLLARDPFGEKPLYYIELPGGGLAFASELHALERVPGFDNEVSLDAMAEVLMFQYIGAPRTIYRAVKKLPPGHWLSARLDTAPRVGRYFEFLPGASGFDNRTIDDLADELEDILARSIKRRLISDVPLGAFLSGGVDSSTVCALVRKKLGLPLKTFSIGFKDAPESEHEQARAFAHHLGTEHYDQILAPDASEFLLGIGRILDEPNADSSCMPTYLLSRFARQRVTVALSGDGGDEMFGGYGRYFITLDEESGHHGGSSGIWQPGGAYYSDRILVSTEKYIEELFGLVPEGLNTHLGRLRTQLNQPVPPLLCRLRKADVDNYMPGAVLPKVDRMSMQHSLEVRTPFLNVELARFAEKLPLDVLYGKGNGKLLLRKVAYRYLPKDLIDAPKKGFGIPMSRWGRDALLNVASQLLKTDDSRLRQALGPEAIGHFLKRQRGFGGFSTYQVWALAMLESWLRHHPAKVPEVSSRSKVIRFKRLKQARPVPQAKTLVAWPLGKKLFAVVDGSIRLDGDVPASEGGWERQSQVMHNILQLMLLGGNTEDDLQAIHNGGRKVEPIMLPENGRHVRGENLKLFQGSMLIFPEPESAKEIDFAEMRRFQCLGVAQMVFIHPYRYPGTLIRFRLKSKGWMRRLKDSLHLYEKRICSIGAKSCAIALIRAKFRNSSDYSRYESIAFPQIANEPETELSGRYMLFEGIHQLPPLPVSHEDISLRGGGRYSVWSQRCIFSPSRTSRLLLFPYWLVEKTERTEPYLDIVPELIYDEPRQSIDWAAKLAERLGGDAIKTTPARLEAGDRIVVLTHALPPGGAERQWCYLAQGLKHLGYEVTFITTNILHGASAHHLPLLRSESIEPIALGSVPLYESLSDLRTDEALWSLVKDNGNPFGTSLVSLTSLLKKLRPKAIFAQLDSTNILSGIAGIVAGVPRIVLSFRNYNPSHFSYLRNDWFEPCYRILARYPSVILSGNSHVANADYASWIGISEGAIKWIPNAIDADCLVRPTDAVLDAVRKELGICASTPVVLGVFRLSEEKQPLVFLEVCRQLVGRVEELRVFVAGVGPMLDELEIARDAMGLRDVVKFLGRRDDVPALMCIASVVLLTSAFEGMPNVLLEAEALGIPVVATNVGGVSDCVQSGVTGYIVAPDDVEGLTSACLRVLQDPQLVLQMGRAGAKVVRKEHSIAALAQRHVSLVNDESRLGPIIAATTSRAGTNEAHQDHEVQARIG